MINVLSGVSSRNAVVELTDVVAAEAEVWSAAEVATEVLGVVLDDKAAVSASLRMGVLLAVFDGMPEDEFVTMIVSAVLGCSAMPVVLGTV